MPATVAVVDGTVHVGLADDALLRVAEDEGVVKASIRDLGVVMARGGMGATTVAATSYLAHLAGIRVFATGGLGGVHRGARETWDESADLAALGSVPMTVVCAGVKSILDVAATLERLESLSVTVLGYRTDVFPGFYVRDTGLPVPWRVDEPGEVAAVMRQRHRLGLTQGWSWRTRSPRSTRSTPTCTSAPCRGARGGAAGRGDREGRHAVPAGVVPRAHRGREPAGQRRAGALERAPRRGDRRRRPRLTGGLKE